MRIFTTLARITFGLTILFAPFRWRIVVQSRPNPPVYGDYTDILFFLPDFFLLLTLLFWILSPSFWRIQTGRGPIYIWLPLLALTLAAWVSVFISEDRVLSQHHAFRLLALLAFFFYIVNEVQSLEWVALPLALQMALQSAVALGQSLAQKSLGLQALGELSLDPTETGVSIVAADGVRFLRAYGLTDHPNILGGFLAFGLVLLLAAILQTRARPALIFLSLVFIPSLAALFLTFSRSAWIAFGCGNALLVTIEAGRGNAVGIRRGAALVLLGALTLVPFAARLDPFLGARLNRDDSFLNRTPENLSLNERVYVILAANQVFVDHSLTGIGLAAAPQAMKDYYPVFGTNYQPPHFTLLAVAMETGALGALPYFLLGFVPFLVFLMDRKRMTANPFSVAAAAVLLAVTLVGLFDYYTWTYPAGRLWQWLAWGLWSAAETT